MTATASSFIPAASSRVNVRPAFLGEFTVGDRLAERGRPPPGQLEELLQGLGDRRVPHHDGKSLLATEAVSGSSARHPSTTSSLSGMVGNTWAARQVRPYSGRGQDLRILQQAVAA